ncbi:MAG: DNA polymerase III PolC-type [Catillopecten margaritatus gill symbiont]|uniref:DNA polymerase III PolC-type n=1 Tax=Catillopecten margaritatus gill symbiont TaxID=3083288 RepID=A0AAU6PIB9_9GAMM
MMFLSHFLSEYRRKKLLNTPLEKPLHQYLSQPLVSYKSAIQDIEFLVLDFETTGLDASKEKIISIGYTVIKNLRVLPQTSTHILVNPKQALAEQNVAIHQLTDEELKQGLSLSSTMKKLLTQMHNRVVIVHFDKIEKNFINQACRELYQVNALPMIMLDTLQIEQKKRQRIQQPIKSNDLRLFTLRETYHLPRYTAHNAMQDAIATAELFLAQVEYMGNKNTLKLQQLI